MWFCDARGQLLSGKTHAPLTNDCANTQLITIKKTLHVILMRSSPSRRCALPLCFSACLASGIAALAPDGSPAKVTPYNSLQEIPLKSCGSSSCAAAILHPVNLDHLQFEITSCFLQNTRWRDDNWKKLKVSSKKKILISRIKIVYREVWYVEKFQILIADELQGKSSEID